MTGVYDVDNVILNSLYLDELESICQTNHYLHSLCQNN